jgi:molybdenum-dependent DNA-binding transcriptional regulator ModE
MTDLNSLVVFAKVVEAKSFSEAARRLGMPVSTVSRRVAELEDQLGVRLLDRSTRNLRQTDLGSEVLEHAQRSAEASEAVQNIVSNRQSSVSGTLRLSQHFRYRVEPAGYRVPGELPQRSCADFDCRALGEFALRLCTVAERPYRLRNFRFGW